MKKLGIIVLVLILLGFLVRLYRFDNPVADWHSFRQSDTNAVSSRYKEEGINLLYPKYYDISNVQSGFNNPQGYRMVEFPIYNASQSFLANIGFLTLEQWGRLVTIFMSLLGGIFVYLLTKKYSNEVAGLFALVCYLFLPFSIFYGRSILPDPSMASAIMGGIYFFDLWIEKSSKKTKKDVWKFFVLACVFTSIAFLLKPFALFYTLPMIYVALKEYGFSIWKKWQLWLFALFALLPLVLWRWWIGHFPEGIPVSDWLFNGNGIRFRPAFFRWIFFERITKLILGYAGILFVLIGLVKVLKDKNLFFLSFAISSLLYVCVIATGNVQHDYYQILLIPTISMFAGIGLDVLYKFVQKKLNVQAAVVVCVLVLSVGFYFSWMQVRDYFNINDRGMVEAASKANEILPKNALIIAPYDGSTVFLNISKRKGWPVFQESIEELIERGAQYLVIANPTPNDFNGFGKNYEMVASGSTYLILKLK